MAYPQFTPEELETEEWRDVVGFEGYYKVSNLGRVKSVHTKWIKWTERLLRPNISGKRGRYPKVTLVKNKKHFYRRVHCLVAAAFLGVPLPDKQCVNHIDSERTNNRSTNLEYCDHQGNTDHAGQNGRLLRGQNHPLSVFTNKQVVHIKNLIAKGFSNKEIAAIFTEATTSNISRIRNHRSWLHIS